MKPTQLITEFFDWQARQREWQGESKEIEKRTPEEASKERARWQREWDEAA